MIHRAVVRRPIMTIATPKRVNASVTKLDMMIEIDNQVLFHCELFHPGKRGDFQILPPGGVDHPDKTSECGTIAAAQDQKSKITAGIDRQTGFLRSLSRRFLT